MNTKTILGLSFAAVFAVSMIGSAYAGGVWSDLIEAESAWHAEKNNPKNNQPERYTIEGLAGAPISSCGDAEVCGIGSFVTNMDPGGYDAAMAVFAKHVPFCDHVFQDADAAGNSACVLEYDNVGAVHPHMLFFNLDADCNSGVALAAENDLEEGILELGDSGEFELKVPTSLGWDLESTVHSWTVEEGPYGEICPVIIDSASDE